MSKKSTKVSQSKKRATERSKVKSAAIRQLSLTPYRAFELSKVDRPSPKEIINQDNRKPVQNVLGFPFRAICQLDIFKKNTDLPSDGGTGFLISPRCILTAGHNVYTHNNFVHHVDIYLGLDGDRSRPRLGSATSRTFRTVSSWATDQIEARDFAVIFLKDELADAENCLNLLVAATSAIENQLVVVSGYPVKLPVHADPSTPDDARTQWFDTGKIAVDPKRLRYLLDTSGGQSGAPVLTLAQSRPEFDLRVIGIHNYGERHRQNYATRITKDVATVIAQWVQEAADGGSGQRIVDF
jgi:V8-like Glu-specific endopeptidase